MRVFECPAEYRKYFEANVALILAEIGRDQHRRNDEDEQIRRRPIVPNQFIDTTHTGTLTILVGERSEKHFDRAAARAIAAAGANT